MFTCKENYVEYILNTNLLSYFLCSSLYSVTMCLIFIFFPIKIKLFNKKAKLIINDKL